MTAQRHRHRTVATTDGDVDRLPRLIDLGAVAEHLGVNERHVRRLVAERRIPFIKWGRLLRFDPKDIAAWIERSRSVQGRVAADREVRLASRHSTRRKG